MFECWMFRSKLFATHEFAAEKWENKYRHERILQTIWLNWLSILYYMLFFLEFASCLSNNTKIMSFFRCICTWWCRGRWTWSPCDWLMLFAVCDIYVRLENSPSTVWKIFWCVKWCAIEYVKAHKLQRVREEPLFFTTLRDVPGHTEAKEHSELVELVCFPLAVSWNQRDVRIRAVKKSFLCVDKKQGSVAVEQRL